MNVTFESALILIVRPTEPVKLTGPTGAPAGEAWPHPAIIGAMDEQVFDAIDAEGTDKLLRRYVKDAGFRKADLKHYRLDLIKVTGVVGSMHIVHEDIEFE